MSYQKHVLVLMAVHQKVTLIGSRVITEVIKFK